MVMKLIAPPIPMRTGSTLLPISPQRKHATIKAPCETKPQRKPTTIKAPPETQTGIRQSGQNSLIPAFSWMQSEDSRDWPHCVQKYVCMRTVQLSGGEGVGEREVVKNDQSSCERGTASDSAVRLKRLVRRPRHAVTKAS